MTTRAQLSPTYPHDVLYQLKCCLTVLRITQTDRMSRYFQQQSRIIRRPA